MSWSLFYLTTALLVSGITITHLQEHKTTVTTASGNHYIHLFSTCALFHNEISIVMKYLNGNLITEKGTGEQNPLFQLVINTMLRSATTLKQQQINTPQHSQISSNSSTIAADNSTSTYIIHYSIELIEFFAEYTLFNDCNFNLVYWYSLSVNLTLSVTV
jgi:hypothetical protein